MSIGLRLDYILAPTHFTIASFDTLQNIHYSDHRPVYAVLRNGKSISSTIHHLKDHVDYLTPELPKQMVDDLLLKFSLMVCVTPIEPEELSYTPSNSLTREPLSTYDAIEADDHLNSEIAETQITSYYNRLKYHKAKFN